MPNNAAFKSQTNFKLVAGRSCVGEVKKLFSSQTVLRETNNFQVAGSLIKSGDDDILSKSFERGGHLPD